MRPDSQENTILVFLLPLQKKYDATGDKTSEFHNSKEFKGNKNMGALQTLDKQDLFEQIDS